MRNFHLQGREIIPRLDVLAGTTNIDKIKSKTAELICKWLIANTFSLNSHKFHSMELCIRIICTHVLMNLFGGLKLWEDKIDTK